MHCYDFAITLLLCDYFTLLLNRQNLFPLRIPEAFHASVAERMCDLLGEDNALRDSGAPYVYVI